MFTERINTQIITQIDYHKQIKRQTWIKRLTQKYPLQCNVLYRCILYSCIIHYNRSLDLESAYFFES